MTSGIYIIINNLSNKCYIGQSINVEQRHRRHIINLSGNRHTNSHLQASWNIHGRDTFSFDLLEICKKEINILTEAEQHWMDYFKFIGAELYNMCPSAGSCLGYKHTQETRDKKKGQIPPNKGKKASPELKAKLSLAHMGRIDSRLGKVHSEETKKQISEKKTGIKLSEEHKEKIRQGNLGRVCSEETKHKLSLAHKGRLGSRLGYKTSDETKAKMSLAQKGRICSEETKYRLRLARKGKPSPIKGKKLNKETGQYE